MYIEKLIEIKLSLTILVTYRLVIARAWRNRRKPWERACRDSRWASRNARKVYLLLYNYRLTLELFIVRRSVWKNI